MTNENNGIDEKAIDSLSVAPGGTERAEHHLHRGDAGGDTGIAGRMASDPDDGEARLDRGLDESMDASDPPASTQPGHDTQPAPSSGYDPVAEASRQRSGAADDE